MTIDEAAKRLAFHVQPEAGSFLYMLRPYQGIRDDILSDVKATLRACAPRFSADNLPRELVHGLWAISYFGRAWALEPEGMLRRNGLITDGDQRKLAGFLEHFDYAVAMLLDGAVDAAFADWP
jgi:hypothetical protein